MRQRFEQQLRIGSKAISEVTFPLKSRDEMPPVLKALQYIFVTPELNEKVFAILEENICKGKNNTGRKGMDLWHILVLAVVRHALDTNWDRLEYLSNYDQLLREILGVHTNGYGEKYEFNYQSILDNVHLIKEQTLQEINAEVVQYGRSLYKKKEQEELRLKTDSYVLETNVHFPTDLNLLYDSLRKCLDIVEQIKKDTPITGWRKIKALHSSIKSTFRSTSQQVFKGKSEKQKKQKVKQYLGEAQALVERCKSLAANPMTEDISAVLLQYYMDYAIKFIDQIERRLLKGETIPADEKVYSIFEPHTEWITKGKLNKRVELGHLLLITTEQHGYIVDYKIMRDQKDPAQIPSLSQRLQQRFAAKKILSHSFDQGFFSKANRDVLKAANIEEVILPKKGKKNKAEQKEESTKSFIKLRHAHSAIESNINMLEHHGLNRCVDKGMHGFNRCVGLSVLAYNLHRLGNELIAIEKKQAERLLKKQGLLKAAA